MTNTKNQIEKLTLGAIFTALVAILQTLAGVTTFFGPFSTAVGLIPIVLGACLCGPFVGAWLGFVFGAVVILTGGAALFMGFDIPGTFITVLAKGTLCGLAAGLTYRGLSRFNEFLATFCTAVICPLVNTAVFLLGCYLFFMDSADAIAESLGLAVSGMALFWALAMGNFILEIASNAVLSPVIIRVISLIKKKKI